MKKWCAAAFTAVVCAVTACACFGDIPGKINYHGKITTPAGRLVEGAHDMVFRMFAEPSGGTEKWSETHGGVSIVNGLCNVVLGAATSLTPVFQENEALYLEVSVDGETLVPRQEVASVGYAMRSSRDNPVGTIQMYGGTVAPSGWLLCRGQAVSRTGYAALFAVLGTAYGAGDGTTTFNVPNGKGRFAVGFDGADASFDAMGETGGEKTHTLTTGEMPSHSHGTDVIYPFVAGASRAGLAYSNATSVYRVDQSKNTGEGEAHNTLPPYIAWNYMIKY